VAFINSLKFATVLVLAGGGIYAHQPSECFILPAKPLQNEQDGKDLSRVHGSSLTGNVNHTWTIRAQDRSEDRTEDC